MSTPYFNLESFRCLTFCDLRNRLISLVVSKIRNGEFTERRLARVLNVSQPQLHNVLKGARPLKPEFADVLMRQFEIGVLDLFGAVELNAQLQRGERHYLFAAVAGGLQNQLGLGQVASGHLNNPGKKPAGKGRRLNSCQLLAS